VFFYCPDPGGSLLQLHHSYFMEETNMKKLLAMMMALAMVLSLAACGGSSTSSDSSASTEESPAAEESQAAESEEAETPAAEESAEATGTEYKVGIVNYVDDASLNQIVENIESELDAKGAELGVTFNYADYYSNAQADSAVLNQIGADLIADQVDIIVAIATPVAMVMQSYTEDNQIPVVFAAVTDPVGAGLVDSLDAPGGNITGSSDALDTTSVLNLALAANPDMKLLGLLYDTARTPPPLPSRRPRSGVMPTALPTRKRPAPPPMMCCWLLSPWWLTRWTLCSLPPTTPL
jgi:putative ABC transport system substrate-binding protein